MRIGIFTDAYLPQINGVVSSIVTLKEELIKRGHTVYIITTKTKNAVEDDSNLIMVPSVPFNIVPDFNLANPVHIRTIRKVMNLNLDVIHSNTEFSMGTLAKIVSKLTGCPLIHTYHTLYENYTHYIPGTSFTSSKRSLARKFSKFFCDRSDMVIVPTQKVYDILQSYNVNSPISVVPSGIKIDRFSPSKFTAEEKTSLRHKLGLSTEDNILLYVGRLSKEKDIDVIFNQLPSYCKENKNLKFLIVGDGPYRGELESMAANLGISNNVIFAGFQPQATVSIFYQIADAFISASKSETQGLTYVEAMASGLPVIAKKDPCLDWIFSNSMNECIFEEAEEIPSILNRILTDEFFKNSVSHYGIRNARLASPEAFAKAVEGVYYDALALTNEKALQQL